MGALRLPACRPGAALALRERLQPSSRGHPARRTPAGHHHRVLAVTAVQGAEKPLELPPSRVNSSLWRPKSISNLEWLLEREGASDSAIFESKVNPRALRWKQAQTADLGWELHIPLKSGQVEVIPFPGAAEGLAGETRIAAASGGGAMAHVGSGGELVRRSFMEGASHVVQVHGTRGTEWVKATEIDNEMTMEMTCLMNDGSTPRTSILVLERVEEAAAGARRAALREASRAVGVGSKKEAGLAAAIAFERMILVISYAAPPDFVEAALQNLKDKYPVEAGRPGVTVGVRVQPGGLSDGIKMLLSDEAEGLRKDLEEEAIVFGDIVLRNIIRRGARRALDSVPGVLPAPHLIRDFVRTSVLPSLGGLPVPYVLPTGTGGAVGGVKRIDDLLKAAIPALDEEEAALAVSMVDILDEEEAALAVSMVDIVSAGAGPDLGGILDGEIAVAKVLRIAATTLQAAAASGRLPAILASPEAMRVGTFVRDWLNIPSSTGAEPDPIVRDLEQAIYSLDAREIEVLQGCILTVASKMWVKTVARI